MRRNPATVVALAGHASESLLGAVSGSMNVALIRPGDPGGGLESAAAALRRAAGISSPYVLVAADPLAAAAAEWRAMWEVAAGPRGGDRFEVRAGEALAAWRAGQFELPDYYLVLAEETGPGTLGTPGEQRPDFHLGPLRSVRPHRVAVVAAAEPAAQAAGVLSALGSLRHGRWWPSLEEIIGTARGFYPGDLAESPDAGQAGLLARGGSLSDVPGAPTRCADACQVPGAAPAAPPGNGRGRAEPAVLLTAGLLAARVSRSNVRPPRHDGGIVAVQPATGAWLGRRVAVDGNTTDRSG